MKSYQYLWTRVKPYFGFFLIAEFIIRSALTIHASSNIGESWLTLVPAFTVGILFDIAAFVYLMILVALYATVLPHRLQGTRFDRIADTFLFGLFTYIIMFSAVSEWIFWDEFQSRFNFIAVDYLVYTHEVVGNIWESYPVGKILGAMALVSGLLGFLHYRHLAPARQMRHEHVPHLKGRAIALFTAVCIAAFSFVTMRGSYAEITQNRYVNEIARNGIYELFSAYLNNELDYEAFYTAKKVDEIIPELRKQMGLATAAPEASPLAHQAKSPTAPKKYNLVMITVESLSAKFLGTFGNTENLTPHLDKLADKSLLFTQLYATGTRTVYGLSSLTLAMPPVPGNSIVRRPNNDNLFSLGSVLRQQGYKTQFIYGGYGYFDNMNAFFANNGYDIIDRNNLSKEEITFANVWGVADDDLFRRAVKENDKTYQEGKPFFNMIMTTSNHRPFTYADGKIDIPSHTGRSGGVKYTDYAIDDFLTEARKHPWFKDTIFVIVADHTADSAGKSDLDPTKYHIPMLVYAPGIVKPGKVDWMASQIDVAPTLLGLMGISYESRFYGQDLMKNKPERAFISNYQQLGYLTKEGLVILKPVRQSKYYKNTADGFVPGGDAPADMMDAAIAYYQGASKWKEWSKLD